MLVVVLVAVACGGERSSSEPPTFRTERGARPAPVAILRSARDTVPGGKIAGVDIHVLMPVAVTAATARATLQHVIDSVAAGDILVAGIRAVGFMIGEYDPGTREAEVVPALIAVWAPVDTVGFTGRSSATRFRTTFTMLRPFPEDDPPGEEQ